MYTNKVEVQELPTNLGGKKKTRMPDDGTLRSYMYVGGKFGTLHIENLGNSAPPLICQFIETIDKKSGTSPSIKHF